jgi:hypothetical protein
MESISFSEHATIGEMYHPAMKITDQAEADRYFEACVKHCMRFGKSREEAESIQRSNLGYFAGYYDDETMARVNRLFRTTHPIFGGTTPTAEEAFQAGVKMAKDGARPCAWKLYGIKLGDGAVGPGIDIPVAAGREGPLTPKSRGAATPQF